MHPDENVKIKIIKIHPESNNIQTIDCTSVSEQTRNSKDIREEGKFIKIVSALISAVVQRNFVVVSPPSTSGDAFRNVAELQERVCCFLSYLDKRRQMKVLDNISSFLIPYCRHEQ